MKEKNKILNECYEDNFIKTFKPELNRRMHLLRRFEIPRSEPTIADKIFGKR